jgi:hypothetical protein
VTDQRLMAKAITQPQGTVGCLDQAYPDISFCTDDRKYNFFLCGLNQILHSVISSFCHDVDENCAFLGYDTVSSSNLWPTFWDNLLGFLTPEDGTDRLSWMSVRGYHEQHSLRVNTYASRKHAIQNQAYTASQRISWQLSPKNPHFTLELIHCQNNTTQHIPGDQKVLVHLMITVQNTQKYSLLNSFNHLPW